MSAETILKSFLYYMESSDKVTRKGNQTQPLNSYSEASKVWYTDQV